MPSPSDFDEAAWLFGEEFDLQTVLARGRNPAAPSVQRGTKDDGRMAAVRRTAGWLAVLAAMQAACGAGLAATATDRSAGLVIAAAALSGVYAAWLALTPLPAALAVVAVVTAVMALGETGWAVHSLVWQRVGFPWSARMLALTVWLVALLATGLATRNGLRLSRSPSSRGR